MLQRKVTNQKFSMDSSTIIKWKCFKKVSLDFFALRKGEIIKSLSDNGLDDSVTYPTMISTRCYLEALGDGYTPFFTEGVRVKSSQRDMSEDLVNFRVSKTFRAQNEGSTLNQLGKTVKESESSKLSFTPHLLLVKFSHIKSEMNCGHWFFSGAFPMSEPHVE